MDAGELIRYTHSARGRYLKMLNELSWSEVVKDRGASFSSIRDILLHTIDMEDRTISHTIPATQSTLGHGPWKEFEDVKSIEKRINEVEEKTKVYLANLSQSELDREVTIPRRVGTPFLMRVEDILVQLAIENISHFGELIAILWQIDVQPPFLGWANFLDHNI
ncbi:MAG: hypothetical protein QG670_1369 [Thermoproteota archaeon]|nr:hypothetical protein [Thermoproteota archaeon]